jgi:hypothetical protein
MTEAEPKALEPAFAEGDIEKNKGLSQKVCLNSAPQTAAHLYLRQ